MSGNLEAGVARADITPPVGVDLCGFGARKDPSRGVHDRLETKALFLDDGRRSFAIVTADIIGLPRGLAEEFFARLQQECALTSRDVIIAGSHTHSGPNTGGLRGMGETRRDYVELLIERMVAVTLEACEKKEPAGIGAAVHECTPELSYNRVFGEGGPLDREIGIIRVASAESKKPLAILVNYACHPVVLGPENLEISADYPGALQRTVEEATGAVCMFANGACGDINPTCYRERTDQPNFEAVQKMGAQLGREVLQHLDGIETASAVTLRGGTAHLTLPFADEDAGDEGGMPIELKALAVDDTVLVAIPAEVFVEVALAIKRGCVPNKVFVIGYSDYVVGYIPTAEDFRATCDAASLRDSMLPGYASTEAPHWYDHPPFRSDVAEIVAEKALHLAAQVVSPKPEGDK